MRVVHAREKAKARQTVPCEGKEYRLRMTARGVEVRQKHHRDFKVVPLTAIVEATRGQLVWNL